MKMVANVRIMTAVVLLLSHQRAVKVALAAIPWNYEGGSYGPSYWPSLFPNYCNGTQQSPIDIRTNTTVAMANYTNLVLTGYNEVPSQPFQLLDNGHSVQVNVVTRSIRATGASLMNANYTLDQFHFHWGTTACNEGSEHQLDGKSYPMEIHFVHYNSDKYADFTHAVNSNDPTAVTVFGVFVDVAASSSSADLDVIISNISSIPEEGDTVNVSSFAVQKLLPCTSSKVYTYLGSLTTPNCSQVVLWNVFEKPIFITLQQLAQFRTVMGDAHTTVDENHRPVQPLNGRTVSWFNVSAPSGVTSCYSSPSLSSSDCMTSTPVSVTTIQIINEATGLYGQVTATTALIFAVVSCLSAIIH